MNQNEICVSSKNKTNSLNRNLNLFAHKYVHTKILLAYNVLMKHVSRYKRTFLIITIIYPICNSMLFHGQTRSIAACSKPRFHRNQEMPDCPTDGAVCPPKIVQK